MTTADERQFTPSTASITVTWSASSGADNYTIMVTPLLPSGQSLVSTTTTWSFDNPAISSLAGTVTSFIDDPGFGFEIHVLNSSSSSTVISELRVTAVRQLNGVTVECLANSRRFTSTIQLILSVPG